jgi:hypothetical protein
MKTLHLVITVVVLTMLIVPFMSGISTNAAEEEEILVLIETAETPEDHIKIAEYYEEQASQMEKMASLHESMGKSYAKRSKPMSGMAKHCSKLSKKNMVSAEIYKSMATHHREMAQGTDDHDSHQHE